MKRITKLVYVLVVIATILMASCAPANSAVKSADTKAKKEYKDLVVGFAQIGAESGWRTAETDSIKAEAEKLGVKLQFSDAQQKQENQIKAIRSFIAQKVDVIAFSPVVESGWGTVLREAKAAKIPVVLTERAVDSKDTSLYVT